MDLPKLYEKMAEMTAPKCASCRIPHYCCTPEQCRSTKQYAEKRYGVVLPETEHPRLPFMGENGCTVPPHLRPTCTVHVCGMHLMDEKFADKYFKLRDLLNEAEWRAERKRQRASHNEILKSQFLEFVMAMGMVGIMLAGLYFMFSC